MRGNKKKYRTGHESAIAFGNFLTTIFGTKSPGLIVLILLTLFILVSAWLPELLADICGNSTVKIGTLSIGFVNIVKGFITLVFFGMIIHYGKKFKQISSDLDVQIDDNPAPAKALLLFLSPLGPQNLPKDRRKLIDDTINNINTPNIGLFRKQVDEEKWSWMMPAIAINHHKTRLEMIYVIPSIQTNPDFDYFVNFLKIYFNDNSFCLSKRIDDIPIIKWPERTDGLDFADAKVIFEAVNAFYDNLKIEKIREQDAIVDITGGLAITSVAASMATLARGRESEYVHTNTRQVLAYDLTYQKED